MYGGGLKFSPYFYVEGKPLRLCLKHRKPLKRLERNFKTESYAFRGEGRFVRGVKFLEGLDKDLEALPQTPQAFEKA